MAYFKCKGEKPYVSPYLYEWDFKKSLTDLAHGQEAEIYNDNSNDVNFVRGTGLVFSGRSGYVKLFSEISLIGHTMEVDIAELQIMSSVGGENNLLTKDAKNSPGKFELKVQNYDGYLSAYSLNEKKGSYYLGSINNKSLKIIVKDNGRMDMYIDDEAKIFNNIAGVGSYNGYLHIGSSSQSHYNMTITGVRIYTNPIN